MIATQSLARAPSAAGLPHLRFVVGGVDYAVPVQAVHSVEALPPLTWLPFAPAWLRGLAAAGGRILAAIDLGTLLAAPPLDQPHYVVVLRNGESAVAAPVEAIRGVERMDTIAPTGADPGMPGSADEVAEVWCQGDLPITVLNVSGLFRLLNEQGEYAE